MLARLLSSVSEIYRTGGLPIGIYAKDFADRHACVRVCDYIIAERSFSGLMQRRCLDRLRLLRCSTRTISEFKISHEIDSSG
jgi:hypothetical protein